MEHLDRLAVIRGYLDAKSDNRKVVGAVAADIIDKKVLNKAYEEGLYVIAPSGESIEILPVPEDFKAREW